MSFPTIAVQFYYSSAWNDLGTYCVGFSVDRGRQRLLERHKAGTLVLVMDNSDGTFDPANNTNLKADTPVRVRATSPSGTVYQVAGGTIDDFDISWNGPDASTAVIRCTDNFKMLNRCTYTGATAGNPITAGTSSGVGLDYIVIDSAATGVSFGSVWATNSRDALQDMTTVPTTNALSLCQSVADSQNGEFFSSTWDINSSYGVLGAAFRLQGFESRWRASVATFSDDPTVGQFPYDTSQLRGGTDDDFIINAASITRTGGTEQTANDYTSAASHRTRDYALSGTYALADVQSLAMAEHLVAYRAEPGLFGFTQIALEPDIIDTNAMWDITLGVATAAGSAIGEGTIDFGSRVTVNKTPPYGSPLSREMFVTGVRHDVSNVDGSQRWRTTLMLADASKWPTTALITDDATTGLLDGSRTWG